ncbi:uncharacterized protein ColSpa_10378 [Colletotrichum spaethianum]|uniref:Uncharacterized protein n=1 Tax=Colletotrichum spaethianum TaxID=700344 RepID=A0AA37PDB5_9PEZI|nr:uncharacterized protein ColSpa_10378 [Colletotrichum spaethianum]GKT50196.1 hypothetical protein ColSpa_10378 [Colletotrichum spaethianum]
MVCKQRTRENLHSAQVDDFLQTGNGVILDNSNRRVDLQLTLNDVDTDNDGGGEIRLDLVDDVVLVIVRANNHHTRTGNGTLKTRGTDLDTQGGLDLLVVYIRRLETQFTHRRRRQQGTDVCADGTFHTTQDDPVTLTQDTVRQDNVDGHAETLDGLDLENGSLDLGKVHEGSDHALLGELDDELQHVGDTLTSVGGGGDEGNVLRHGLVLVEKLGVEALLGKGKLGLLQTVLELVLDTSGLQGQTLLETVVVDLLPAVQTIDFVESNNEGSLPLTEHSHRLQGLRLEAVHDIDNKNGDVAEGIDDQQTWDLELKRAVSVDNGRLLPDSLDREVGSTNLLSNTTGFALLHVGLTDLVQKLGLSGIDVAQNTANGRSEVVLGSRCQRGLVSLLATLCGLPLALKLGLASRRLLLIFFRVVGFGVGFGVVLLVLVLIALPGGLLGLAVGSLLLLLLFVAVGVPAVLDVLLLGGGGSLPVVLQVAGFSGLLLGGSSFGLGLFLDCLLLRLLVETLGLLPGALGSLGKGLLFIDLQTRCLVWGNYGKTNACVAHLVLRLAASLLLVVVDDLLLLVAIGLVGGTDLDTGSKHLLELTLVASLLLLLGLGQELALLLELFNLLLLLLLLQSLGLLSALVLLFHGALLLLDSLLLLLGHASLLFLLAAELLLLLLECSKGSRNLLLLTTLLLSGWGSDGRSGGRRGVLLLGSCFGRFRLCGRGGALLLRSLCKTILTKTHLLLLALLLPLLLQLLLLGLGQDAAGTIPLIVGSGGCGGGGLLALTTFTLLLGQGELVLHGGFLRGLLSETGRRFGLGLGCGGGLLDALLLSLLSVLAHGGHETAGGFILLLGWLFGISLWGGGGGGNGLAKLILPVVVGASLVSLLLGRHFGGIRRSSTVDESSRFLAKQLGPVQKSCWVWAISSRE